MRTRSDHPRTRGVYVPHGATRQNKPGSSPHARGLPSDERGETRYGRIIPARAGFTPLSIRRCCRRTDHPRTRGVYSVRLRNRTGCPGSSPHARGLHQRPAGARQCERIIPARAGFTASGTGSSATRGDHPRTRGVYVASATAPATLPGSSPHARGLQDRHRLRGRTGRIIPARAGFTTKHPEGHPSDQDHPRTRGVYSGCGPWGSR